MSPCSETRPNPPQAGRTRAVAALIIAAHLALALTLSFIMVLGRAPDEPRHYAYVRWLAQTWTLPPADESLSGGAHSLHPPLYYLTMVPLYYAFSGYGQDAAMRAMRCAAPLFGAMALWLIWPIVWRAAGKRRYLAWFILAAIGLWPNLTICVAMVNNDAASVLMAAMLLYTILIWRWDTRLGSAAVWGAVLGLASLAKFSNFIAGAPAVGVALAIVHGRHFYTERNFYRGAFIAAICCLAVCGWWWYRNLLLWGAVNPYPTIPTLPEGLSIVDAVVCGYAWPLFLRAINGLWASTWPTIDWAPPVLMPFIVTVLRLLTIAAVAGAIMLAVRGFRKIRQEGRLPSVVVPAAAYGTMLLALIYVATFKHMGTYRNARYVMPFLPGLVIPMALSWRALVPRRLRSAAAAFTLAFLLFLNAAGWYYLITHWNPIVTGSA